MYYLLKACLLPPLLPLLVAALGAVLWRRRPRLSRWLVFGGLTLLWLLSTPVLAALLLRSHQVDPALDPKAAPLASAIVVLGADLENAAPEYGDHGLGPMSLQRVRYGAYLHRKTGVPVLVSGGEARPGTTPLGVLMQRALVDEFQIDVRWLEAKSDSTFGNAVESAALLRRANVETIYLVTHAWHMPRARAAFESQGLRVVAAPTAFRASAYGGLLSLVPSWSAVRDSYMALHEWYGRVWYDIRYY